MGKYSKGDHVKIEVEDKDLKLHVRQMIQKPLVWIKIVAVAEALYERKELTRAEVEAVMLGVHKKDLQQRLHMTEAEAEENERSTNEMIRRVNQAAKKKRADTRAMREHWVNWREQAERAISTINVTTTDKAPTTTVE
jgi:hypothetical protein